MRQKIPQKIFTQDYGFVRYSAKHFGRCASCFLIMPARGKPTAVGAQFPLRLGSGGARFACRADTQTMRLPGWRLIEFGRGERVVEALVLSEVSVRVDGNNGHRHRGKSRHGTRRQKPANGLPRSLYRYVHQARRPLADMGYARHQTVIERLTKRSRVIAFRSGIALRMSRITNGSAIREVIEARMGISSRYSANCLTKR